MSINSINNAASSLSVGNLDISVTANTIASSDTNGNINLVPDGTGLVGIAGAYTLPAADGSDGQVLTTDGAGAVAWESVPDAVGLTWTVITGNTQSISVSNGYVANNSGQAVDFTLPATAAVGDVFEVNAIDANGFQVLQNASQLVYIGNQVTTTGITGSLASTAIGDWIRFVCVVANTEFIASVQQGNITVV